MLPCRLNGQSRMGKPVRVFGDKRGAPCFPGGAVDSEGVELSVLDVARRLPGPTWIDSEPSLSLTCEYRIVHLLASNVGSFVTYRAVYDWLHHEGFIAGDGATDYRANVRSAIKRIRNKFRDFDPPFDEIENYTAFGNCWKKPA
jgi:two-component system response regulator ChvI